MARGMGWSRAGVEGTVHLPRCRGQGDQRRGEARADRGARDPARVEGRLDRADGAAQAPGDRRRRRRADAVPVPPRLPRPAGAGQVRQARPFRRTASRPPRDDGRAHAARRAAAGAGRGDRRAADQPRLVPRRQRPVREEPRARSGSRPSGRATCRSAAARISFRYRGKHSILIRSAIVDPELAAALRELLALPGARLFQFEVDGERSNLDSRRLNDYIREHLGDEFTAKEFRTWGGTMLAAIELAEHGSARERRPPRSGESQR